MGKEDCINNWRHIKKEFAEKEQRLQKEKEHVMEEINLLEKQIEFLDSSNMGEIQSMKIFNESMKASYSQAFDQEGRICLVNNEIKSIEAQNSQLLKFLKNLESDRPIDSDQYDYMCKGCKEECCGVILFPCHHLAVYCFNCFIKKFDDECYLDCEKCGKVIKQFKKVIFDNFDFQKFLF